MHRAQQILDALYSKLSVLITNGDIKELHTSSAEPPRVYPSLVLAMGSDDVLSESVNYLNMSLAVSTDIVITSNSTDLDRDCLNIRVEVHKAIMSDRQLGLPFVINTKFTGQSEPEHKGDADTYAAYMRLTWQVDYRTHIGDQT